MTSGTQDITKPHLHHLQTTRSCYSNTWIQAHDEKENRSHILLRYAVIIGLIFLFAGAVVYNSLDNTVLSAPKWNEKAMQELSRVVSLPPTEATF